MVKHDNTTMLYIMLVPLRRKVGIFTKISPDWSVRGMGRDNCVPSVALWLGIWCSPLYSLEVDSFIHTVVSNNISLRLVVRVYRHIFTYF